MEKQLTSRISPFATILFFLGLSISLPHVIQAIFPGGKAGVSQNNLPPEERPVTKKLYETSAFQTAQFQDNVAWMKGEANTGLLQPGDYPEAAGEELLAEVEPEDTGIPLDTSPGLLVEYEKSWDSLETERQILGLGGFIFLSSSTHIQAMIRDLRFEDETDEISGSGGKIEIGQLLPHNFMLVGGFGVNKYDGLHSSEHGYVGLNKSFTKLYLSFMASWSDMWERLINIRDKLRLFDLATSVTYEFARFWTFHVMGDWGRLSDHNERSIGVGEVTYHTSFWPNFSIGLGMETLSYLHEQPTYWSPSYYHLVYGRFRWSNRPTPWPFPFTIAEDPRTPRLTGMVEYVPGVNNDGYFEQSIAAGVRYKVTPKISGDVEASYFTSEDRFDEHYNEKKVNGKVTVRFP